jgi:hypothetical protein
MTRQFSILLCVLFFGCGSPDEFTLDLGLDYFPISTKDYRIYQVEETIYNFVGSETKNYQLRESITDSLISDSGEINYVLMREIRSDASENWKVDSLWSVRKTDKVVVINENNVPFMKLSFPIKVGESWNGNAYNEREEKNYLFAKTNLGQLSTNVTLGEVITVVLADVPKNLVRIDQRYEVYARGIGLVEKNYNSIEYCTKDCDATEQIIGGRVLKQFLISYESK